MREVRKVRKVREGVVECEGVYPGWYIAVDQCNVASCVTSGKLLAAVSDCDKVDKVAVSLSASPC